MKKFKLAYIYGKFFLQESYERDSVAFREEPSHHKRCDILSANESVYHQVIAVSPSYLSTTNGSDCLLLSAKTSSQSQALVHDINVNNEPNNVKLKNGCPDSSQRFACIKSDLQADITRSPRLVPRMGTRLQDGGVSSNIILASRPQDTPVRNPYNPLELSNKTIDGHSQDSAINAQIIESFNPMQDVSTSYNKIQSEFCPWQWRKNAIPSSKAVSSSDVSSPSHAGVRPTGSSSSSSADCYRQAPLRLELNNQNYTSGSVLSLTMSPAPINSRSTKNNYEPLNKLDLCSYNNDSDKNGVNRNCQTEIPLNELYHKYADVMYTNRANLQHTIAIQQRLFQQQLVQRCNVQNANRTPNRPTQSASLTVASHSSALNKVSRQCEAENAGISETNGDIEWVVKRRADGSRYISRRSTRSKLLKERAKKIAQERAGLTTDDDAASELKAGRYWNKEERRRHAERSRDRRRNREIAAAKQAEGDQPKICRDTTVVELSRRKMLKHKGKKALDDFITLQEILAHGNSEGSSDQSYHPLLTVTTV